METMPLGLYISVPFCRTKCSYCNFASGVFSRDLLVHYVDHLCADIARVPQTAAELGGQFERDVDSIYLGGGTPTMLPPAELERIFRSFRQTFDVQPEAEITVECAPGTLAPEVLDSMLRCGVNRVSLGVQSFVDGEAAAVGRLHTRYVALDDIARLRAAGVSNINVDLIAGLPHQTAASWRQSLDETIAAAVPHVSVYMLEVDEDSRLGRELMAGGTRYHAHFVPDEDATANFYLEACGSLDAAGIHQYEISNFARPGCESRHNLKYWTRLPYLGFGVDAHSMLYRRRAPGAGPPTFSSVIPSEDRASSDRRGFGRAYARSESRDLLLTCAPSKAAVELGGDFAIQPAHPNSHAQSPKGETAFSAGRKPWVAGTIGDSESASADDTQQRGRQPERPVALRFSTPDSLGAYLGGAPSKLRGPRDAPVLRVTGWKPGFGLGGDLSLTVSPVSRTAGREEAFFLGLRLTRGINLRDIEIEFGKDAMGASADTISQLRESGLLETEGNRLRLTPRGRLLSNEVFQRFLSDFPQE